MWALEVGKLGDHQILRGRAAIRTVGTLLHHGAGLGKGMLSEGNNLFTGDEVLSVRQHEELERLNLLLTGLVAQQNYHLGDALDRSLENGLDLPDAGVVVS